MAKSKHNTFGLELDLDFEAEVAESWKLKGIDVEEYFVPDYDANAFRVDGVDDDSDEHECRYVRPVLRPVPRRTVKYEKAAALARDLGMLRQGERVDCICSGKFIMGDFIEAYMVEHNLHTERLLISTLSYNENNVDSLFNLLDGGYVDRIDLVVSAYFFAHERNQLIRYAYKTLDDERGRFQLAVCNVHTKTYQFRTDEGLSIIMQGSGNMRACANFENMIIEENAQVFDFYQDFFDGIIREYSTIQKGKRFSRKWFQPDDDDGKAKGEA